MSSEEHAILWVVSESSTPLQASIAATPQASVPPSDGRHWRPRWLVDRSGQSDE